jgi:hypothetical protein
MINCCRASFNSHSKPPPPATGAFNASPFNTITPTSGKNLPYEPELGVNPNVVSPVYALFRLILIQYHKLFLNLYKIFVSSILDYYLLRFNCITTTC